MCSVTGSCWLKADVAKMHKTFESWHFKSITEATTANAVVNACKSMGLVSESGVCCTHNRKVSPHNQFVKVLKESARSSRVIIVSSMQ